MMQRTIRTFPIDQMDDFKQHVFVWSQQFETIAWLDSNEYEQQYTAFDSALAVEEFTSIKTDYKEAFDKLKEYQSVTKDYIFGYISYDVKNDVEQLSSDNLDELGFSDLYFFQPQKLIFIKGNNVEFQYLKMVENEIENDFQEIQKSEITKTEKTSSEIKIKLRIHKDRIQCKNCKSN